jgi:Rrf2 family protein
MKISTRTRYGLRLLVCLASSDSDALVQVKEVAKLESIPPKYLEQIIRPLKKAGMLKVVRGAKGGYFLGRPPEKITVKEVFDILENENCLIKCLEDENICKHQKSCSTYDFWYNFNKTISEYLEGVTIADIVKKQQNIMFYI